MSIPIETLTASTPEELGQILKKKLNLGFLLKGFKHEDNQFMAFISANEILLPEMNDDEFDAHLQDEAKKSALKRAGLD